MTIGRNIGFFRGGYLKKQIIFVVLLLMVMSISLSGFCGDDTLLSQSVAGDAQTPVIQEQQAETGIIVADSVWVAPKPSIRPLTALYHSLVFPGWGQYNNGKKWKALLFFTAEMVCIGGYLYEWNQVKYADVTDLERDNIRLDRNTYFISWMVSKVLGIMDAYVDAQFADFDVKDITPEKIKGQSTEHK